MENLFYNILWIDDEHESLSGTKGRAKRNGINLIPFKSLSKGMSELERNFLFYDGVLLDAKFFENEDDIKGSEDTYNVHRAKEQLLQLKKKFEVFVLTGQAEAYQDKTFRKSFEKVYKKGSDNEMDRLFEDIIISAKSQEDTQIRHSYSRVFEVCTEKYIGDQGSSNLLAILKKENQENAFTDPDIYLNPLRKIMDDVFISFNKYGFLPEVFIKPFVALNESSKFLSGAVEKGYQLNQTILPKVISDNVRNILAVCQPASHRSEIDSFIKQVNSPYLLLSVTYQLLDVLLWFKLFIDNNNNIELNKTIYKMVENSIDSKVIVGIIEQDNSKNYHCGEIILTWTIIKENNYQIGDDVRILKTAINSNKNTMELYPLSALQTEKT
jgi:hypothetical protein